MSAQNVGDYRTAGSTNARTYFNSDLGNYKPPLKLFETIDLTGVSDAQSLLAFEDFLLVGEGGTNIEYHVFDRTAGNGLGWTRTFPGNGDLNYVPAYAHDIVLLGGPATTTVKAVRVSDNALLWEDTQIGAPVGRFPVLTDNLALYHGPNRLVARDATTGTEIWRFATTTAEAPISVFGSRVYLLGETSLYALDLLTGAEMWNFPNLSGDNASVIATEKRVFVNDPGNSNFYAINAATGSAEWNNQVADATFATNPALALAYDRLYAFVAQGNPGANIKAYDPDTGNLLWEALDPNPSSNGVPAVSPPSVRGNCQ